MLTLLKRYREPLLVALLLLYPFGAYLTTGRRGREPHLLDRALIALTAPVQRGLVGLVQGVSGALGGYVALRGVREENDALRLENLRLRAAVQALSETRAENERLRGLLAYVRAQAGEEVAARVVGVDPAKEFLAVRIDRGEQDGVFKGMSVVTPEGIVGMVARATGRWADVALVTDPRSRVAVRVQRTRARGTAAGAGKEPLRLETVLRTEDVEEGDLIVTAGTDGVFPPGLVVGRISARDKRGTGMFHNARIAPAVDTSRLEEVLVVPAPSLEAPLPAAAAATVAAPPQASAAPGGGRP